MTTTLIKNARLVNEERVQEADLRIKNGRIDQIGSDLTATVQDLVVDAAGNYLLPGMIDDQVHFREPGLTHKGTIASESRAAVAGGITSYMEMPNVTPPTTTAAALQEKNAIAAQNSLANYAFYLGATEDNLDEIKAIDTSQVCGVKVFMGASTGNLLVENPLALEAIFRECPTLIATHCESGPHIKQNLAQLPNGYQPTIFDHPKIRDAEACYQSSSYAVQLAKQYGSRLHVLHITTEKELSLFTAGPIQGKQITAEACVHHLWFNEQDYETKGNFIKCNPSIKRIEDRDALIAALHSGQIDIIATDHAPHTLEEKQQDYPDAPAGLPLVEHALLSLMDHVKAGRLSIEQLVTKTAHNPAIRYGVAERGFIREGYFADLVLINPDSGRMATNDNARYRCQWTPFDGHMFSSTIQATWVNGQLVFDGESIIDTPSPASQLIFS